MQWSEWAPVLCGSIFVLLCSAVVPVREKTQARSLTHSLSEHCRHATLKTHQGLQTAVLMKCAPRVQIVTCKNNTGGFFSAEDKK